MEIQSGQNSKKASFVEEETQNESEGDGGWHDIDFQVDIPVKNEQSEQNQKQFRPLTQNFSGNNKQASVNPSQNTHETEIIKEHQNSQDNLPVQVKELQKRLKLAFLQSNELENSVQKERRIFEIQTKEKLNRLLMKEEQLRQREFDMEKRKSELLSLEQKIQFQKELEIDDKKLQEIIDKEAQSSKKLIQNQQTLRQKDQDLSVLKEKIHLSEEGFKTQISKINKQWEQVLAKEQSENQALKKNVIQFKENVHKTLNSKFLALKQEIKDTKEDYSEIIQKTQEQAVASVNSLKEQCSALNRELNSRKKENFMMQQQITQAQSSKDSEIAILNEQLQSLQTNQLNDRKSVNDTISNLKIEKESLVKKLNEQEQQVKNGAQISKQEIQELQKQNNSLLEQNQKLLSINDRLENELESAKQADTDKLKNLQSALKEQENELQNLNTEQAKQLKQKQTQVAALQQQVQELEKAHQSASSESKDFAEVKQIHENQIQALKNTLQDFKDQYEGVIEEKQELIQEMKDLNKLSTQQYDEINDIKRINAEELKRLQNTIKEKSNIIANNSTQNSEKDQKIKLQIEQIESLKQKEALIAGLEKQINQLKVQIKEKEENEKKLRIQVEQANKAVEIAKAAVTENQILQEKINKVKVIEAVKEDNAFEETQREEILDQNSELYKSFEDEETEIKRNDQNRPKEFLKNENDEINEENPTDGESVKAMANSFQNIGSFMNIENPNYEWAEEIKDNQLDPSSYNYPHHQEHQMIRSRNDLDEGVSPDFQKQSLMDTMSDIDEIMNSNQKEKGNNIITLQYTESDRSKGEGCQFQFDNSRMSQGSKEETKYGRMNYNQYEEAELNNQQFQNQENFEEIVQRQRGDELKQGLAPSEGSNKDNSNNQFGADYLEESNNQIPKFENSENSNNQNAAWDANEFEKGEGGNFQDTENDNQKESEDQLNQSFIQDENQKEGDSAENKESLDVNIIDENNFQQNNLLADSLKKEESKDNSNQQNQAPLEEPIKEDNDNLIEPPLDTNWGEINDFEIIDDQSKENNEQLGKNGNFGQEQKFPEVKQTGPVSENQEPPNNFQFNDAWNDNAQITDEGFNDYVKHEHDLNPIQNSGSNISQESKVKVVANEQKQKQLVNEEIQIEDGWAVDVDDLKLKEEIKQKSQDNLNKDQKYNIDSINENSVENEATIKLDLNSKNKFDDLFTSSPIFPTAGIFQKDSSSKTASQIRTNPAIQLISTSINSPDTKKKIIIPTIDLGKQKAQAPTGNLNLLPLPNKDDKQKLLLTKPLVAEAPKKEGLLFSKQETKVDVNLEDLLGNDIQF